MLRQQHVRESKDKRDRDSPQGHIERGLADSQQVLGTGFQTYGEQKKYRSDAGDGVNGIGGLDQMKAIGPDDDASQDFAQNRRQMQPLKDLAEQLGPDENQEEL